METRESFIEDLFPPEYPYAKELIALYNQHNNINYEETLNPESFQKIYKSAVLYAVTGEYSSFPEFHFHKDTSLEKCECKMILSFDCKLHEMFSNCLVVLNSLLKHPNSGLYSAIQRYVREHYWSKNISLDPANEWDMALSTYNIFDEFINMVSFKSLKIGLNEDNTQTIIEVIYQPSSSMYNYIDIYQYFWFVMFEKAHIPPIITGEWEVAELPPAAYGAYFPKFDMQDISYKIDKLFEPGLSDSDNSRLLIDYLKMIMDSYKKSFTKCFLGDLEYFDNEPRLIVQATDSVRDLEFHLKCSYKVNIPNFHTDFAFIANEFSEELITDLYSKAITTLYKSCPIKFDLVSFNENSVDKIGINVTESGSILNLKLKLKCCPPWVKSRAYFYFKGSAASGKDNYFSLSVEDSEAISKEASKYYVSHNSGMAEEEKLGLYYYLCSNANYIIKDYSPYNKSLPRHVEVISKCTSFYSEYESLLKRHRKGIETFLVNLVYNKFNRLGYNIAIQDIDMEYSQLTSKDTFTMELAVNSEDIKLHNSVRKPSNCKTVVDLSFRNMPSYEDKLVRFYRAQCSAKKSTSAISAQRTAASIYNLFEEYGVCCRDDIASFNFLEALLDISGIDFFDCFIKRKYHVAWPTLCAEMVSDTNNGDKDIRFYIDCRIICNLPDFANKCKMLNDFYNKCPNVLLEFLNSVWENELNTEYKPLFDKIFSFDSVDFDSVEWLKKGDYFWPLQHSIRTKLYLSIKNGWDVRKAYAYFRGMEISEGKYPLCVNGKRVAKPELEFDIHALGVYLKDKPTSNSEKCFLGSTLILTIADVSIEREVDNFNKNTFDFIKVKASLRSTINIEYRNTLIKKHSSAVLGYIMFKLFRSNQEIKSLGLNEGCFKISDVTIGKDSMLNLILELKDEFKNVLDETQEKTNFF